MGLCISVSSLNPGTICS